MKTPTPHLTSCPTCGSTKIRRVCRDLRRSYHNQAYVVPRLEFFECPDCGEHVYDRDAMRKIAAASPASHKPRRAAVR